MQWNEVWSGKAICTLQSQVAPHLNCSGVRPSDSGERPWSSFRGTSLANRKAAAVIFFQVCRSHWLPGRAPLSLSQVNKNPKSTTSVCRLPADAHLVCKWTSVSDLSSSISRKHGVECHIYVPRIHLQRSVIVRYPPLASGTHAITHAILYSNALTSFRSTCSREEVLLSSEAGRASSSTALQRCHECFRTS